MTRLGIEECVRLQSELKLNDVHVVSLDEIGFSIAHTDHERATIDLESCPLHDWLLNEGPPEVGPGLYTVAVDEHDGYSESFRSDPWDFKPLETP